MKLLTLKEVSKTLKISRSTVHRICKSGELGSVKIGARRLVADNVLTRFMLGTNTKSAGRRILTNDQIDTVEEQFGDRDFCFCGRLGGLGVAVRNEAGYNPIPFEWYIQNDYQKACDDADFLNRFFLDLTDREAMLITASTMREVKS